jgi:hypothetical protein
MDHIGDDFNNPLPSLHIIQCVNMLEEARLFLFPPLVLSNPFTALKRAFLSPRNIFVDEFNEIILQHLPGNIGNFLSRSFQSSCLIIIFPSESFYSANTIKENEHHETDPDFLSLITHISNTGLIRRVSECNRTNIRFG